MNYTILVNRDNPLKDRYFNYVELVEYENYEKERIRVEKTTLNAYLKLKDFLEDNNIFIGIDSAYRDIKEQDMLIDFYREKYGDAYVSNYVAPAGKSEHHTGLAIDLSIKVNNKFICDEDELLENEDIFFNIHKYLYKFGFILRYPKKKEKITGYNYEPWHIRYVGLVPAKIIYENNLSLEEYLCDYSGILVVNKKKGVTSRDVVNEVSKILGIKRIGHTGTLDPLAEGVLVLTIGKATKISELLTATYKEYEAGVLLGVRTDTRDITGEVIDSKPIRDDIDIEKVLKSYKKTYMQEVPIYSAVKVAGKKLYEYARGNENVSLPKKKVTIKEIELMSSDRNTFMFKAMVSKGCYIRSLIDDMGQSMETFATMTKLTRTKQGKFSIDDAYKISDIKSNNYKLLSIEDALDYPVINLSSDLARKVKNGVRVKNTFSIKDKVIFKYKNELLGIYQVDDNDDELKTWKNFKVN